MVEWMWGGFVWLSCDWVQSFFDHLIFCHCCLRCRLIGRFSCATSHAIWIASENFQWPKSWLKQQHHQHCPNYFYFIISNVYTLNNNTITDYILNEKLIKKIPTASKIPSKKYFVIRFQFENSLSMSKWFDENIFYKYYVSKKKKTKI